MTTAPDGVIAKVNQTFLALTGYANSDLVGRRRFVDLLTAGGRIYHETHYTPMLEMQGSAREIALDIVCSDGRRIPVLVNSVMDKNPSGDSRAVRTAVFDATQRREYERELLREKDRAEASEVQAKALARTLQQILIPPSHPKIPGLDLAAAYRPAGDGSEVGGDFYDVFETNADDWFVVIGDVCGKGVEAAVVTALARYTIRAAAVREKSPSQVLHTLNEVLLHDESDRFCTVCVLCLRRRSGVWLATISSGGHPLPYLIRYGMAPTMVGLPGSLVGVSEVSSFSDATFELGPHDLVVLYTDGITEGRSSEQGFYGDERFAQSLDRHRASPARLAEGVLADVLQFQSGRPRDDIAFVAISASDR